ncbi:MAG: glycosyltransferase family 4 protein [Candidatus Thorarchaeota archaeon]
MHVLADFTSEAKPFFQPFVNSQIKSLEKEGVEIGTFSVDASDSRMNYFRAARRIKELVIEEKYEILHAHYSYCGLSAYLARAKKPIVISLMGSDLIGARNRKGKITLRGKLDNWISRYISTKVNHIIVKSRQMANLLDGKIPISVIPNGVDLELFQPMQQSLVRKELGFEEEEFMVLFFGNPRDSNKNFVLAEKAVKNFKSTFKHSNVHLVNPYGISHDKVVKYLNACDVLILTSYYEGSPNVIKEAMACNLPIISTDVGDVKDIISNIDNCFITNHSTENISNKLEMIYNNRQRTNGRHKMQELSSEVIAEKIIKIYQSIIKMTYRT